MIKSIEQLISGRYEYTVSPPIPEIDSIDVSTAPGKDIRGRFRVSSSDGQRMRGFGRVTNARIVLAHDRYTGKEIAVDYGIDVGGLKSGDTINGEIVLSLNTGEMIIPVRCEVREGTGMRRVNSLQEFASIARNDYAESFRLYTDGSLADIIENEDNKTKNLYKALSQGTITYQHLEQFLVASGLKEELRYSADKNNELFEHLQSSAQGKLRITKNTWGNVNLTVSAKGSFLSLPQKHFLADDFVGNTLEIEYIVKYEELGEGLHKGTIEVDTDTDHMTLHVSATRHSSASTQEAIDVKKAIAGVCRDIIDYRLQRNDGTTLVKKCVPRIAAIRRARGEQIELDLIEAYAYSLVGAWSAVAEIIKKWKDHDFGGESASYEAVYTYLARESGLIEKTDAEFLSELETLFAEDENSLIILLILMRIDKSLASRPGRILSHMSRMYRNGSYSPFLYMEAALILKDNAHLLNSLSAFAKNVIIFAQRNNICSRDMALRTALLSENEKTFTPGMYRILTQCYKTFPMVDILDSICRLIMKGNPRRREFHQWYALAVEEDLRITRLYEYYMETLPDHYRKPLPVKILRYFTLNNTLGAGRKALLYSNIILNKEYDPETYKDYAEAMSEFATQMAEAGNMNEDFAVLYREFIKTLPTKEQANAMANVMFKTAIITDDPSIREVIVVHRGLAEEESYPVYHGKAYVDIYSDDSLIVFKDERGRRFEGKQYRTVELIDYLPYLAACRNYGVETPGIVLNTVSAPGSLEENEDRLQEYMQGVTMVEFSSDYRREMNRELLSYFRSHKDSDSLDLYLAQLDVDKAAQSDPVTLIEIMVERGMVREAFKVACKYGYEEVSPELLAKMCDRMISLKDFEYDEELMLAAEHAFKNGADTENTLKYLVMNYDGKLDDMVNLRKAADRSGIDTSELEEKILKYAMLVHRRVDDGPAILRNYIARGGSAKVRDAYLIFEALGCFYEDRPLDRMIAAHLSRAYDTGKEKNEVCYLALLRRYVYVSNLTKEEEKRRNKLLKDALRAGYMFSFYEKLPSYLKQIYQLDDKLIIETRALPGERVKISYRNNSEGEEDYREEPMRRQVGGIFAKAFIMFGGQELRYRIIKVRDGEESVSEEMSKKMPISEENGRSTYRRISKMIEEEKKGDYDAFAESLRKYRLAKHTVEELFPLRSSDEGST